MMCSCKNTAHEFGCALAGPLSTPPVHAPPPVGWICPVCGAGMAPHEKRCPCVPPRGGIPPLTTRGG